MDWDALKVLEIDGELRFGVHARPKAKRAGVEGLREGALVVALRSPPDKGAANDELVETLASVLGLPKRQVRLVRGASSRQKTLAVTGLGAAELRARLARAG
jgi:hypothetical protein